MLDHLGAVAECTAANLFAVFDGVARDADDAIGAPRDHEAHDPRARGGAGNPDRGARHLADGALSRPTRSSRPARERGSSRSPRSTAYPCPTAGNPIVGGSRRRLPRPHPRPAVPAAGARAGRAMKGATAIVVGGGILGATTACELARGGLDVLLLEAGRFGEQSTGKSAAIVRCHYSNPEVVRMARPLARDAPAAAAPARVRPGLHAVRLAVPRRRGERGSRARERRDAGRGGARHLRGARPPAVPARASRRPASPTRSTSRTPASPIRSRPRTPTSRRSRRFEGARARGHAGRGVVRRGRSGPGRARRGRARRVRQPRAGRRALDAEARRGHRARAAARDHARAGRRLRDQHRSSTLPCAVSSQIDRVYMRPAPEHGAAHLLVGRGFPKEYENVDPDVVRRPRRRRVRAGRPRARDPAAAAAWPACAASAGASASTT